MSKTRNTKTKTKKTLKNRSIQFGGNDSINVLSWNICWEAMEGSETPNGTAKVLAKTCSLLPIVNGLNGCANNVIKLIDTLSVDCDFLAMQEAAKWEDIYLKSTKLQKMNYVHHKSGKSHLITFYNKEKYIAVAVNIGTIVKDSKGGRPYHIIYLQNKTTKEIYIFINLHNAHNVTIHELEEQLSKEFNNFININDGNISDAHEKKNYYPIEWSANKYNVIVAGDFNDKNINYWNGLNPFKNANITNLQKIVVKTDMKPPNTCCRVEAAKPLPLYGDYILVNDALMIVKNNYVPDSQHIFPTSDHLPVLIELQTTQLELAPSIYLTKYIYAFDIDDTLCPYNTIPKKTSFPTDEKFKTFRTKVIENMKIIIESKNYVWIVTANKYTKEAFVNKYFDAVDHKLFNNSNYFYFMNEYIIKDDYKDGIELRDSWSVIDTTPLTFTISQIHSNGLKPYAIYAKSFMEMINYNQEHVLKINNFKIFLFDDNNKESLKKNCKDFNITFFLVTDFTTDTPNLLENFDKILLAQQTEQNVERQELERLTQQTLQTRRQTQQTQQELEQELEQQTTQQELEQQTRRQTRQQTRQQTILQRRQQQALQTGQQQALQTRQQTRQQQALQTILQTGQQELGQQTGQQTILQTGQQELVEQRTQQELGEQRTQQEIGEQTTQQELGEQRTTIEMKEESSSGNMFTIPLLAMVCALPFIFLLSK